MHGVTQDIENDANIDDYSRDHAYALKQTMDECFPRIIGPPAQPVIPNHSLISQVHQQHDGLHRRPIVSLPSSPLNSKDHEELAHPLPRMSSTDGAVAMLNIFIEGASNGL